MTAPFRGSSSEINRQRLRAQKYERLSRDVYVLRDAEVDLRVRAEASRLIFPDGIPCLTTSAQLLRLPVNEDDTIHLARGPKAARSERDGVKVHRLALRDDELYDLHGLTIADGPRTFNDLANGMALEDLVAVGDVVLKRWGADALEEAVSRCRRRPGAVLLRQALPLVDKGSDSPAETRARLRLHAAGFTALKHKVTVRDEHGGWLGVPDLADEVAKVALQHEGAIHFTKGETQRKKDIERDEVVRARGGRSCPRPPWTTLGLIASSPRSLPPTCEQPSSGDRTSSRRTCANSRQSQTAPVQQREVGRLATVGGVRCLGGGSRGRGGP